MLLNLGTGRGPLYRRLYLRLKSAIGAGRLQPGARMPSTRALATDLGVSRNTVVLAYEQLIAEGYLISHNRSTNSVAGGVPTPLPSPATRSAQRNPPRLSNFGRRLTEDPAMPPSSSYAARPGIRYDFRYGRPAVHDLPRPLWRRLLMARARGSVPDTFGYGPPAGYAPLRLALRDYLARARGVSCDAEQIVIVNGSQQAFDLAARVLIDEGDNVVVEEPRYTGASLIFEALGARLIGVPVDAEGLDTDKLPGDRTRVKLACVTPCHQFPTGVIMPLRRRLRLLDWAARTGAWVIEDDYVSEFRYEGRPLEALQALDHNGQVIYVGTFSKTLFPSLRLGFVVLPHVLVRPVLAAKFATDRYSPMLAQEVMTDFITGGHFERHLRRSSARNAARRQTLIDALTENFADRIEIAGENAGVHLIVWLNEVEPRNLNALIGRAAGVGVGLYPVSPFYAQPPQRAGLLFGYASLTEADIRAGIRRLASVI